MNDNRLQREIDELWQRLLAWSQIAKDQQTPVHTLQQGVANYISDVTPTSIGRRSVHGTTNRSRTTRAEVARVWKALREHGATKTPEGVLYFTPAIMVAALPEVEHVGNGILQIVDDEPGSEPVVPGTARPEAVELESHDIDAYQDGARTAGETVEARRREAQLVADFAAHLGKQSGLCRHRYSSGLVCDIFVEPRMQLIEAKADASRESIRMAIGQLFDYRHHEPRQLWDSIKLAVLVPENPGRQLEALLEELGISIIWRDGGGFTDNAAGLFSSMTKAHRRA